MELVTRGIPCLRLFNSADKDEVKVYEILADAFCVIQARLTVLYNRNGSQLSSQQPSAL